MRRLLLKQISEEEIRSGFPKDLDKHYLDNGIENYCEELASEEIIIYCCAECGDYVCGGFKFAIDKESDKFVWTFNNDGKVLKFHFARHQYLDIFNTYRKQVENDTNYR